MGDMQRIFGEFVDDPRVLAENRRKNGMKPLPKRPMPAKGGH
jgi:hypothetical protein